MSYVMEVALIVMVLVTGFVGIGVGVGHLCRNAFGVEGKAANFLAWANAVTWMLPGAGFITSGASLALSLSSQASSRKMLVLGLIGLALSLVNGLIAVVLYHH